MSNQDDIQAIILHYLNGESTEEEVSQLNRWKAESSANAKEFETINRLWQDSANASLIDVDTEGAWQKVREKTINKQPKTVKLSSWTKVLAFAASLFIVMGLSYYLYQNATANWTETVAINQNKTIQLLDGSTIILREGSKISLPKNYGKESRTVKLEGEAFFEVVHNEQMPFSVVTAKSVIRDIGTAFLVQSFDSIERVAVREGEVSFASNAAGLKAIHLKAGQSAILKNGTPQVNKIDTVNLLSWNSKRLIFKNTLLWQVADDLEQYYHIKIVLPNRLRAIQITATFSHESLEQVLTELHLLSGLQFKLDGKKVIVLQ